MSVMYAHTIKILRKIDPSKRYAEYTYYEVKDYEGAIWYDKGEIIKIGEYFYQVDIKENISSVKEANNLIVKHGRHIIKQFNY